MRRYFKYKASSEDWDLEVTGINETKKSLSGFVVNGAWNFTYDKIKRELSIPEAPINGRLVKNIDLIECVNT